MGTYEEMREYARKNYGGPVIQNCWIADRKETHGVPMKTRHKGERVKPCPPKHAPSVDRVLRHFGVIGREGK